MASAVAKRILRSLRLYRPVRLAMHWGLNRGVREENERALNFYARFIGPGALVFDVGANIGRRSEVFSRLGARVIAVEPNPDCIWEIEQMFPAGGGITIEPVAVGASPGTATLHLCGESDRMSSLSEDWIGRMRSSRFGAFHWTRSVQVEVKTLDQLIQRHGDPAFIKIDTEGFELQVLSGLTVPVQGLSFEFSPECRDTAIQCIDLLETRARYEYNLALNDGMQFELPHWVDARRLKEMLADGGAWPQHNNGDIYARLAPRSRVTG
jgi:FkbM family methyltransferase